MSGERGDHQEARGCHPQARRPNQASLPRWQANFAWAYATLGVAPSNACLDALCEHARAHLAAFPPQNISNTAWALATLQHTHQARLVRPLWPCLVMTSTAAPSPCCP